MKAALDCDLALLREHYPHLLDAGAAAGVTKDTGADSKKIPRKKSPSKAAETLRFLRALDRGARGGKSKKEIALEFAERGEEDPDEIQRKANALLKRVQRLNAAPS
jgi:hypothetical protein